MLTNATINKLASRRGVRPSIVIEFLNKLTDNNIYDVLAEMEVSKYNLATKKAVRDGVRIYVANKK